MNERRILVTGGAGFVGSHLVEQLLADGDTASVRVLDDLSSGHEAWLDGFRGDRHVEAVVGSILDEVVVGAACRDVDVVIHLACRGLRQGLQSPADNYRVNAEGALRIALAAQQAGAARFVHVSTSDVYGPARSLPIDEEHPLAPVTVYATGKLAGETAVRTIAAAAGLELMVVRPTNLYGPRCHFEDDTGELIPRTIVRLLDGAPPVVHGSGTQTRDYVHVRDAARALTLLARTPAATGRTVNIGTGLERSVNEVVGAIVSSIGPGDTKISRDEGRPGDVDRRSIDGTLLTKLTGFEPEISFAEGIAEVVKWLRAAHAAQGSAPIPLSRPWMDSREAAATAEVIRSGWVAEGPRVAAFEAGVCEQVGAAHAVAVSSGTAALHLALVTLGIGPGDEVVVPSLSFIATANAVRYTGAVPVFADVSRETQNLTVDTIERALSTRTRAVVVVHQAGVPADLASIHARCDRDGIAVVEDAACALGSTYDDLPIGAHSDLVTFSFHPRKTITTGEGGMLTTARADWAARLRRLREHGMDLSAIERHTATEPQRERYVELGFNYRMSDLQAAVGLVQVDRVDQIVAERRRLGARYRDELADLSTPMAGDTERGRTNYQSFWLLLPDTASAARDEVLRRLHAEGVACRPGIMAAHLEPAYAELEASPLPITEALTNGSILLPLFVGMTEAQQDRVVEQLRKAIT